MEKRLRSIIMVSLGLLVFGAQYACQKEGDEIVNNTTLPPVIEDKTANITFSPSSAFWYYRTQPDSILVQITNGNAPYIVIDRPEFSSDVKIHGNQLIIYPKYAIGSPQQIYGHDFVNIQDNAGNVTSFFIEVGNLTVSFEKMDSISVKLSGDSIFELKQATGIIPNWYASWDRHFKSFLFSHSSLNTSNTSHTARLYLTADTKEHNNNRPSDKIRNMNFQLILQNSYYSNFIPKDTNQTINYTVLDKDRIEGNFNITVFDQNNQIPNDYNLECYFSVGMRD